MTYHKKPRPVRNGRSQDELRREEGGEKRTEKKEISVENERRRKKVITFGAPGSCMSGGSKMEWPPEILERSEQRQSA